MVDFPTAPVVGQRHPFTPTPGVPVFIWDGAKWTADPLTGAVRYDAAQSLTTAEQLQARQNIYAAPYDALAYSGMQINGGMDVSQQYGYGLLGTAWVNLDTYVLDGWTSTLMQSVVGSTQFSISVAGTSNAPFGGGLQNCVQVAASGAANFASATDRALLNQFIEGYRWARLGFGTATNAQSVTIGFWVFATIPGTACLLIRSYGTTARGYIQEYTVNVANTWEYKTLTFPPDVSGAANWLTTNGRGVGIHFCFGGGATTKSGTAGNWFNATTQFATANQTNFYASNNNLVCITGVTVLPGTQAPAAAQSPNIMRPYDQELVTCQRYYEREVDFYARGQSSGILISRYSFKATKRASPTMTVTPTASDGSGTTLALGTVTINAAYIGLSAVAAGGWAYATITADVRL